MANKMKELIIIGARGWGREVLWSLRYLEAMKEFHIKGFLDSDSHVLDGIKGDYPPILSSVEDYIVEENDLFFCAMGDPHWRKHYAEIISEKGGHFYTFISPFAKVCPSATIGEGSFISATSTVSDNAVIGKHVMIHGLCTLGHDVKIGDYVSIESYSFIGGGSEVGDLTSIHVRSTILRQKRIGVDASIGASSVVIRNVPDGCHVFGNPAKKIE